MVSLYDHLGQVVASVDRKITSFYPQPGWVEQDPAELLDSIYSAFRQLIRDTQLKPGQIECLGLANQGESLILWDLESGKPVYNVIGWQCVRSLDLCERLKNSGHEYGFFAQDRIAH